MKRYFLFSALVVALYALLPASPSHADPLPSGTTTKLVLPINQFISGSSVYGELSATFEATPFVGGWSIKATFQPEALTLSGAINGHVSGKATGAINLATGGAGVLTAFKLNVSGGSGERLYARCYLTVDASGTVSVLNHYLYLVGTTTGPCTGC